MNFRVLLIGLTLVLPFVISAQTDSVKNQKLNVFGKVVARSMRTNNRGDLEDFYITVGHADVGFRYQATPWLKLIANGYGLIHFGLSVKKVDPTTGSGSIYEENIWSLIWFDSSTNLALPELKADFQWGDHQVSLGRFLLQSPLINLEPWPFPTAQQGIQYFYNNQEKGILVETALINKISSRFDVQFRSVGDSFGRGAIGFNENGDLSGYTGNVHSDWLLTLRLNWRASALFQVDFWNYYTENIMNNVLIEPKFTFSNGWSSSAMFIYQSKINNGGNADPELTYLPDDQSSYLGIRFNKRVVKNLFQFNFSRIFDQGRLQLTRDWGLEPFYTFQRRTRVEGTQNTTALMLKWQQDWGNNEGQFRWFSSISRAWLPFPGDYERSKYRLPSYMHWDFAFKYSPHSFSSGLSAELYMAYRFLAEDIGTEYRYLINRADFFHADLIIAYYF